MDKIEQNYIINLDDTIANFRAELASDAKNVHTPTFLESLGARFSPLGFTSSDLSLAWRKDQLIKIHNSLVKNKDEILDAIVSDYSIAREEAEIYEYNPVVFDLEKLISKHQRWTANPIDLAAEELGGSHFESILGGLKSVSGIQGGPEAKVLNSPYGIALVVGTRKSELSTLIKPVIASIAAGNYTMVKPSIGDKDRHLNKIDKLIIEILKQSIDSKRGMVLDEDQDVLKLIENHNVDLVFTMKTNSDPIIKKCCEAGVKVIEYQSGWNVGVVSKFANVKEAAELLIHNKFYKSGQHLQNVDIIYVDKSVYNLFLIESKNALYKFYTSLGQKNLNYGTIASKKDFFKILEILNDSHIDPSQYLTNVFHSVDNLRINPILILNPDEKSRIMQGKIYGPILPIVTFEDPLEIKEKINKKSHVENLFYFGENSREYPEIKIMFDYQKLFFNGTNFGVLGGGLGPDYGKHGCLETSLGGRFGMWTFSKQKTFMNLGKYGRQPKEFFNGRLILANCIGTFNFGARTGFGRYLTKGNIRNGAVGAVSGFVLSKFF